MTENKVGEFIKNRRTELSLTQKELAEKIGVTDKAISRWETGKGLPDVSILILLSDVLGASINEILKGEMAVTDKNEAVTQESFDEQVKETARNLIPVIDEQMKYEKRHTSLEVMSGVVLVMIIWFTGFLLSGCQMMFDSHSLFHPNVGVVVFPFVLAALCIGVAVFSAKCEKSAFFKTTMILLVIPVAAALLILLCEIINRGGSTTPLEVLLALVYWPLGSVSTGVFEYIHKLPQIAALGGSLPDILPFLITYIPIILGLCGAFTVYNSLEE